MAFKIFTLVLLYLNKADALDAITVQLGFGPMSMPGAEMVYCDEIGSWVFRHPNILTYEIGSRVFRPEENECNWLWRSFQTDSYNILSTNMGGWSAWIGKLNPLVQVSITSVECSERSHCNYHGTCVNSICDCDESFSGNACQFESPCPSLATEKAHDVYGEKHFCRVCHVLACYYTSDTQHVAANYRTDLNGGMQWRQENPIRIGRNVYGRPVSFGLSQE